MARRDIAKASTAVSVGTGSTVVAAANPSRVELTVVNDGANTVYLQLQTVVGQAPTAVASQGIRLNSGGGSWTTDNFTGAVAGIALTGATNVTIAEV